MSQDRKPSGFTIKERKFDYFFGRVKSSPHNQTRSQQNREDLKKLGIDEAVGGRERLLQIFQQGLNAPEIGRFISDYGITITRQVELTGGAIEIKYLHRDGDLSSIPEVFTIIPKIYPRETS